ncbi:hypothetical protein WN943_014261 [Citrus x changshan-huyou]
MSSGIHHLSTTGAFKKLWFSTNNSLIIITLCCCCCCFILCMQSWSLEKQSQKKQRIFTLSMQSRSKGDSSLSQCLEDCLRLHCTLLTLDLKGFGF